MVFLFVFPVTNDYSHHMFIAGAKQIKAHEEHSLFCYIMIRFAGASRISKSYLAQLRVRNTPGVMAYEDSEEKGFMNFLVLILLLVTFWIGWRLYSIGEIPKNDRESVMQKIASHLQLDGIISITETIFDPHFQSRKYVSEIMKEIGCVEAKFTGSRLAYTSHFKKKGDEK